MLNVRTLAPKLAQLLSLPFDILCLSEVRVAARAKKSLARVASSYGFHMVWSGSPPPSPTFSVFPGGTVILARAPLVLQEVRPPVLEKWINKGRVCLAYVIDSVKNKFLVASCYGHPVSHPDRNTNEAYLREVLAYMGAVTCASILMGDLNDHPMTSIAMASASVMGMHRLSSDDPTTLTKNGELAVRPPLDHCYVNMPAMSYPMRVKVDVTLRISDHLPLLLSFHVAIPRFIQVTWAKPTKLQNQVASPTWNAEVNTFEHWQCEARKWILLAHDMPPQERQQISYKPFVPPTPNRHLRFRGVLALLRAVVELHRFPRRSLQQKDSIVRKLRSLRMSRLLPLLENPSMLLEEAQNKVNCMIRQHHGRCMRDWKAKARLWKISEPAVYSYLRNPFPTKLSAIVDGEDVLTHPWDIQATLMCFSRVVD